jgi:two-component system, LytTR family, response regulator
MNTCIIDDSDLARADLKRLLQAYERLDIISEAASCSEAIQVISDMPPDLLFLDIELTDGDGFQVLKKTPKNTMVIFTTAFDEFAIHAFDVNAVDYLLKPIDPVRLDTAINKALFHSITNTYRPEKRLYTLNETVFVQDGNRCCLIKIGDIRFFQTYGNYSFIYFNNDKIILNKSLNSIETKLDPNHFFRVNRQYIINIHHVKNIDIWSDCSYRVELTCRKQIDISRRKSKLLSDMMSF